MNRVDELDIIIEKYGMSKTRYAVPLKGMFGLS